MRGARERHHSQSAIAVLFLCAAATATAALCAGCAAEAKTETGKDARITSHWQQQAPPTQDARAEAYRTVFVVGVANTDELRRMFEDEFVRQLEGQGVRGIASYATMPPGTPTADEVAGAVRGSGADGVIVTRLLKREQWRRASFAAGDYQAHYTSASQSIYAPQSPVVYRSEVVSLETRLFDAARRQMVWATTTELFDPRATPTHVARLVRALVKDLKQEALI